MNILQAIVLGVVQGLTEFLPVSSSAHVFVFARILTGEDAGAAFTAIIQIGTQLALLLYFRKDIINILSQWFKSLPGLPKSFKHNKPGEVINQLPKDARLGWVIILGTIPIIFFGIVLKNPIENAFRSIWVIVFTLIFFGALLWFFDKIGKSTENLDQITPRNTLLIGLAQCLALVPGVSRSGATITAGRALGFSRTDAARFSFLLSIPSIFAAGLFELKSAFSDLGAATAVGFPGWGATVIATIVSFFVGYIVIAAFMKMISKMSLAPFAVYRVLFALAIVVLHLNGVV